MTQCHSPTPRAWCSEDRWVWRLTICSLFVWDFFWMYLQPSLSFPVHSNSGTRSFLYIECFVDGTWGLNKFLVVCHWARSQATKWVMLFPAEHLRPELFLHWGLQLFLNGKQLFPPCSLPVTHSTVVWSQFSPSFPQSIHSEDDVLTVLYSQDSTISSCPCHRAQRILLSLAPNASSAAKGMFNLQAKNVRLTPPAWDLGELKGDYSFMDILSHSLPLEVLWKRPLKVILKYTNQQRCISACHLFSRGKVGYD